MKKQELETILIVEDNLENIKFLSKILVANNFNILVARNFKDILNMLGIYSIDLFLLNINLLNTDGFKILKDLDVKKHDYEVIILTDLEDINSAKKAMELGAFGYLKMLDQKDKILESIKEALVFVEFKKSRKIRIANQKEELDKNQKELEKALKIVEYKKYHLESIMDSIDGAFVIVDNENTIMMMNKHSEKLFQKKSYECIGKHFNDLYKDTSFDTAMQDCLNSLSNNSVNNISSLGRLLREKSHYYLVKNKLMKVGDGKIIGRIYQFIDRTEEIASENIKNSFFSIVAHEFRTPITVLLNYISVLQYLVKGQDKKVDDILQDMSNVVSPFKGVIDNIINVVNLSRSDVNLSLKEIDIEQFINSQIELIRKYATEKQITIAVKSEFKNKIIIDPKILSTAIFPVLKNAVDFNSLNGTIDVFLNEIYKDNKTYLEILFIDEGVGIPEEKLNSIFSEFTQIENHMIREQGGLGLGLFIVNKSLEILKGSIKVTNNSNKGVCVKLHIPISINIEKITDGGNSV